MTIPCLSSTYLFVKKRITPGALFHWDSRCPLSKIKFAEVVRQTLTAANLSAEDYARHNFRIRAVTTTATAGLKDSII